MRFRCGNECKFTQTHKNCFLYIFSFSLLHVYSILSFNLFSIHYIQSNAVNSNSRSASFNLYNGLMDKVICRGCFNPKKIFSTGLFLFIHDRAKQTDRQTNAHTHTQAILNWLLMYVLSFVLFIKIPTLDITIRIMHLRRCWSNILYIYVHNMQKNVYTFRDFP